VIGIVFASAMRKIARDCDYGCDYAMIHLLSSLANLVMSHDDQDVNG
jgi:hypothetical protein